MQNQINSPDLFMGKPVIRANNREIDRNRGYIVKDLLLAGQVSILCGAPNVGKSAITASAAALIAQGENFVDFRVRKSGVIYVAAEDPNGIADRAVAFFKDEDDLEEEEEKQPAHPMDIVTAPVNLSSEKSVHLFITSALAWMEDNKVSNVLIVFDTLNLCIGESDENSSRDMSIVMSNARLIVEETKGHVMLIHHTSSGDGAKPRGSTALVGGADTVLTIEKAEEHIDGDVVFISQPKQRNVRKKGQIAFRIEAYDAGKDSEGDPLTMPMAVPFKPEYPLQSIAGKRRGSANNARSLEVARILKEFDKSLRGEWVELSQVLDRSGAAFMAVKNNGDSHRKAIRRALQELCNQGKAETDGNGKFRLAPSTPPDNEVRAVH